MSVRKPNPVERRSIRKDGCRGVVSLRELASMVSPSGDGFRMHQPPTSGDHAVLEGHVVTLTGHTGLRIHATDALALDDIRTEISRPPALTVSLVLDGILRCTLDGLPIVLSADDGAAGMLWNTTRPTMLARSADGLCRVRKVNITLPPGWFETTGNADPAGMGPCDRFRLRHLALAHWPPSARAIRNAEDILRRHDEPWGLRRLALEISALDIVHEALSSLEQGAEVADGEPELLPRYAARARAARDFIDDELQRGRGAGLRLAAIARGAGMSASTLNRVFKVCHGATAFDYLRRRRLELARQALVNDGITVAQAAAMAGYGQASNFATAYHREFGYPPSRSLRDGTRKREAVPRD